MSPQSQCSSQRAPNSPSGQASGMRTRERGQVTQREVRWRFFAAVSGGTHFPLSTSLSSPSPRGSDAQAPLTALAGGAGPARRAEAVSRLAVAGPPVVALAMLPAVCPVPSRRTLWERDIVKCHLDPHRPWGQTLSSATSAVHVTPTPSESEMGQGCARAHFSALPLRHHSPSSQASPVQPWGQAQRPVAGSHVPPFWQRQRWWQLLP